MALFSSQIREGLEGEEEEEEEEEEVKVDDVSVKEGDLSGQTRTPVRVRLLLALAGTGVLKAKPVFPGSGGLSERLSVTVTVGKETEYSAKESSTK